MAYLNCIFSLLLSFVTELTKYTQPVFVSREDPNSRQNTIKEIRQRAQTKGAWPQIIIFPEGTCTNRKCLITFKPGMFCTLCSLLIVNDISFFLRFYLGAFYPGVPVQPVCIRYPNTLVSGFAFNCSSVESEFWMIAGYIYMDLGGSNSFPSVLVLLMPAAQSY
jgi:1-acyl-sn-glycerol-3-phosphate acyltransferase